MNGFSTFSRSVLATLSVSLLLLAVDSASAQTRGEAGASFIVGFPQGEFSSQLNATGFGVNAYGAIRPGRRSPILLGIDLGILIYGHERRNEPFSTTIPDVTVDVVTNNNIFLGHLLMRIQPPSGPVRPYLEGLFGLKYLFTETRIENEGFVGSEPIAHSTNFDDTALSYGAGGGLSISLGKANLESGRATISLEFGVRYLIGSKAEYLKRGSIRRDAGGVAFDVTRSETNMLEVRIGVGFRF